MKAPDTRTDRQLVCLIRNGDMDAFQVLYYRYTDDLFRFIFSRLGDRETAIDYVQDIFLQIWEKRAALNPDASVKAYMFKTAHNRLIDHFRKSSTRKTHTSDILPDSPEHADNPELQTRVKIAIHQLPEKEALVFHLSRFDGFSYKEIAQICQVSVKTVEKRMSNALKHLRKHILE